MKDGRGEGVTVEGATIGKRNRGKGREKRSWRETGRETQITIELEYLNFPSPL